MECFRRFRVQLFPIHRGQGDHFTLLSLEKDEVEVALSVRYYDTLLEASPGNLERAEQLLSFLQPLALQAISMKLPLAVTVRNKAVQRARECAFTVCHYVEEEARHSLGEGWASQRSLNKQSVWSTDPISLKAMKKPWGAFSYPRASNVPKSRK